MVKKIIIAKTRLFLAVLICAFCCATAVVAEEIALPDTDGEDTAVTTTEAAPMATSDPAPVEKKITRTIHYRLDAATGEKAFEDVVQEVTFVQTTVETIVDNKIIPVGTWLPVDDKDTFPAVTSPTKEGYKADKATIAEKKVTENDENSEETVVYTKEAVTPTPTPAAPTTVSDQKPTLSVDKTGNISKSDTVTYTIKQVVSADATSVTIKDTLDNAMTFATGAEQVQVLCDGQAVTATKQIDGQTLTVTIADAAALQGKTVSVIFSAKVKPNADLGSYTQNNIASIPNSAVTTFNNDNSRTLQSDSIAVKVSVGTTNNTAATNKTTTTTSKPGNVQTGDDDAVILFLILAVAAATGIALLLRRRSRGADAK